MPLTESEREWYYDQIEKLDKKQSVVKIDRTNSLVIYNDVIRCDESKHRSATVEELIRALTLCILTSKDLKYEPESLYIEKYYRHGHPSSKHDEVDLIILDNDDLPFSMWEFKSPEDFKAKQDEYIQYQLFGTAPLVGAPRLLVFATIAPQGSKPTLELICIDRSKHQSFDSWITDGRPYSKSFPELYTDPKHEPFVSGGRYDLRLDCTQADFRAAAATFHAEFFGEHPDNTLFTNLMKCLLAKILDERQTRNGDAYSFQVLYKKGKEESTLETFDRINTLYKMAYTRYIEPMATEPDEINPKEFPPERVKTVVQVLQGMSLTRGAAIHGDIIGAFFEEILRTGFKQDKGMYFTHANLVYFILEAIDLEGLTVNTWNKATHPENRLPYVIDPACGSGSFLLGAMQIITNAIRSRQEELVSDMDARQFFNARMSDSMPNYWAEHFIYGLDPKFIMAITAKINMVLHGDGSAHTFKYDALKPFSTYNDDKLKSLSDPHRTIPYSRYEYDVTESFDVVVSNPPFGITIASDTKISIPKTFSLKESAASEELFLERWFQLLKPNGRLGVVVPESLLNTTDGAAARLFLYRCFLICAIVSLPRNLFIETPTLTSLLFAQKKTSEEIERWDNSWSVHLSKAHEKLNTIKSQLKVWKKDKSITPNEIQEYILTELASVVSENTQITKKGKPPIKISLPSSIKSTVEACNYYAEIFKLASFRLLIRNCVFAEMCKEYNYEYPVYVVDEVGYKLSKRKERVRPNQLCKFVGSVSKKETPNLHLANEPVELKLSISKPERVLDFIRRDVKWF